MSANFHMPFFCTCYWWKTQCKPNFFLSPSQATLPTNTLTLKTNNLFLTALNWATDRAMCYIISPQIQCQTFSIFFKPTCAAGNVPQTSKDGLLGIQRSLLNPIWIWRQIPELGRIWTQFKGSEGMETEVTSSVIVVVPTCVAVSSSWCQKQTAEIRYERECWIETDGQQMETICLLISRIFQLSRCLYALFTWNLPGFPCPCFTV